VVCINKKTLKAQFGYFSLSGFVEKLLK
jgi:hypothetical protein